MCSKVFRDVPWNTLKHNIEREERACVFESLSNVWLYSRDAFCTVLEENNAPWRFFTNMSAQFRNRCRSMDMSPTDSAGRTVCLQRLKDQFL